MWKHLLLWLTNFLCLSVCHVDSRWSVGSGEDARQELDRTWAKSCRFQPLWKIRNYFGEKIAMYFAWSGMLIISLWPPMLFGFAVFLYGLYLRSVCYRQSNWL